MRSSKRHASEEEILKILQVGLGNFGKRHLHAWYQLGLADQLFIAELDEARWGEARRLNLSPERLSRSIDAFLDLVDVVDVITPTDSHYAVCRKALERGKDVFVEKPMTMTVAEAEDLLRMSEERGRLVQVGFNFRFHPISQRLKTELEGRRLGKIRYVSGSFMGFKRARTDVGVTHTDGIHFLDLFNWLLDEAPVEAYAVCRDHFGRGLEDFSIVLLTYPSGAIGKVESGYIQAGRWKDKVVAGALTTKEIMVVGERATAEGDYETERLVIHDVRHEPRNGVWTALLNGATELPVDSCDAVQMTCRELRAFLDCVAARRPTVAGPLECGVRLATLIDCIYESARTNKPVRVPSPAPVPA